MSKVPEEAGFLALALACWAKMDYYERALVTQCLPGLM
jgi:hypothetical protein